MSAPARYEEWAPPRTGLAETVACSWTDTAVAGGVKRIAPDGCVDLIWDGERAVVAGPDTGPRLVVRRPGQTFTGVRLRPGAAGALVGPAAALRDGTVELVTLWGDDARRLEAALAAARDEADARSLLLAALADRDAPPDPLVTEAVRRLDAPAVRVDRLAAGLYVSERQLRRRFDAAVGYGPRVLARVLRLRRLRSLDPERPLAERALTAGYADQAHMGADVRRLVGTTPGTWLAP